MGSRCIQREGFSHYAITSGSIFNSIFPMNFFKCPHTICGHSLILPSETRIQSIHFSLVCSGTALSQIISFLEYCSQPALLNLSSFHSALCLTLHRQSGGSVMLFPVRAGKYISTQAHLIQLPIVHWESLSPYHRHLHSTGCLLPQIINHAHVHVTALKSREEERSALFRKRKYLHSKGLIFNLFIVKE